VKILVILVHGFNVWDWGRSTVGKLRPFYAAYRIPYIMVDYGHFGVGETYWKNKKIAKKLSIACTNAKLSGYKIILVGHSNGCAIIHQAAEQFKAEIEKAVYINPALDKDADPALSMGSLDVWHSPSDKPVKWSRKLPFHPWGEMGSTGYIGESPKVRNYNKEEDHAVSSKEHSDVFSIELLPYFAPLIIGQSLSCFSKEQNNLISLE